MYIRDTLTRVCTLQVRMVRRVSLPRTTRRKMKKWNAPLARWPVKFLYGHPPRQRRQRHHPTRPTSRRPALPGSARSRMSEAWASPGMPAVQPRVIVGQYICQHCNKGLWQRIPHDTARRNLACARHQYIGNIATLTGKAVADLTEADLRGVHWHDVMNVAA